MKRNRSGLVCVTTAAGLAISATAPAQVINQNFDTTAVGALPVGWTEGTVSGGVMLPFVATNFASNSAPNSVGTDDPSSVSDRHITMPSFVSLGTVTLNLQSSYNTEPTYDGWIVEMSLNGGPYSNIGAAAWTLNGYDGPISVNFQSPIGGQPAFNGSHTAWTARSAEIPTAVGDTVSLRIRMASDNSVIASGVNIDDVVVTTTGPGAAGACCYTNGTCVIRTSAGCTATGGTYRGDGTACGAVVCPVTELVTNGGFETGDFTGWTQWGNTGFTGVDAGLPHSGQFSAYFGPIGSHGGIEQVIPMQAGQVATLEFWYICDPFTPNYFAASFGGERLVEIVDDLTNTQWTLFTFQVAAGTANPVLQFETQHDPAYITLDDITMSLVGGPTCYPNCDGSTTAPCLNVADFGCFLNRFGAGDTYANCDGSTTPPVLNVADFGCFLNAFGAGCSGC